MALFELDSHTNAIVIIICPGSFLHRLKILVFERLNKVVSMMYAPSDERRYYCERNTQYVPSSMNNSLCRFIMRIDGRRVNEDAMMRVKTNARSTKHQQQYPECEPEARLHHAFSRRTVHLIVTSTDLDSGSLC